jgi:hypothetical protein
VEVLAEAGSRIKQEAVTMIVILMKMIMAISGKFMES